MASSFRVLKFNFSGIETHTNETSQSVFFQNVQITVSSFINIYGLFTEKEKTAILSCKTPAVLMKNFFEIYQQETTPIFLLIDAYDHFTNEVLIRNLTEFKNSVSKDGYVRKFYETIKVATEDGSVGRFFITGVSPITLDSLTSGFNIVTHLMHNLEFNELAGFTEENVITLLELVLEDKTRFASIMEELKLWYNGYKFNINAENTIYNSNLEVLKEILETDEIQAEQIYQFDLSRPFEKREFVNFLYYLGNLTIKEEADFNLGTIYKIPNYVIGELYWQYYGYVLKQRNEFIYPESELPKVMRSLAMGNIESYTLRKVVLGFFKVLIYKQQC